MKRITKLLPIILFLIGCLPLSQSNIKKESLQEKKYLPSEEENIFLDSLQYKTFKYFWNEINKDNGLVKDRSTDYSPASIAATGFAIPIWAAGVEHKWISRNDAAGVTLNLLKFLVNSDQSKNVNATGYKGFYYHFLDMNTGERTWDCELSTIDTAWLLAGLRFAANFYSRNTNVEKEIRKLIDQITQRVDWNWATLPDTGYYKNTVTLGWSPEQGFLDHGWVGYNESLYLYIIAAGSKMKNVNIAYAQWLSKYQWYEPYPNLQHVIFPPLFGHQYSHFFIDFRNLADEYLLNKGIDYFENSRRATLTQRKYAIDNPQHWVGYDSLTWGLTACDGPGPDFNYDNRKFNYYAARGTSGIKFTHDDDGTIAPTAAGGSIPFAPEATIKTLLNMKKKYGEKGLWGKYGFVDSFNPTLKWYNKDYLGIDQAAIFLMIENYRSDFVWKYSMQDSIVKKGLSKLGFKKLKKEITN